MKSESAGGASLAVQVIERSKTMAAAWIEVPDESAGWGPVRILRGRLTDDGYHTEEHRVAGHVMIQVTGARPSAMSYPPAWRDGPARG